MWGHGSLECEPQPCLLLPATLGTIFFHLSEPQHPRLPLCVLYDPVNVSILILWLTFVSFYSAVSKQPTSHDLPSFQGHKQQTDSEKRGLGLVSYNRRWPPIVQHWPGLPAQPFHSTNQLLCLCLFKLIQTPSKPERNTAAIVRGAKGWQRECTK